MLMNTISGAFATSLTLILPMAWFFHSCMSELFPERHAHAPPPLNRDRWVVPPCCTPVCASRRLDGDRSITQCRVAGPLRRCPRRSVHGLTGHHDSTFYRARQDTPAPDCSTI